jgi:hypothetical protein
MPSFHRKNIQVYHLNCLKINETNFWNDKFKLFQTQIKKYRFLFIKAYINAILTTKIYLIKARDLYCQIDLIFRVKINIQIQFLSFGNTKVDMRQLKCKTETKISNRLK